MRREVDVCLGWGRSAESEAFPASVGPAHPSGCVFLGKVPRRAAETVQTLGVGAFRAARRGVRHRALLAPTSR